MAQNDLDATLIFLESLLRNGEAGKLTDEVHELLSGVFDNSSVAYNVIERLLEVGNRYLITRINDLYPNAIVKHRLSSYSDITETK